MPGGKLQERRASRFSFFVYMTTRNGFTEKMYRYTSPRQGSLDKQRLSSELARQRILSRDISGILKIKLQGGKRRCFV